MPRSQEPAAATSKTNGELAKGSQQQNSRLRQEVSGRRFFQGKDHESEIVKQLNCKSQQYVDAQVERCSASNRGAKPAVRLSVA